MFFLLLLYLFDSFVATHTHALAHTHAQTNARAHALTYQCSLPADRADDVSVYATVVVAFNEAMDLASTQADFSLLDGAGVPVDGVFLPSSSNSVIFRPSSALAGQTEHTIQILTGAADASGNAIAAPVVTTFSTELVVAPTVVIGSLDGRTDVPVDVAIGMSFSETMDRASVEAAWTLSFVDGGAVVAGTWTWVTDSTFATFTPAGDLPDQTEFNAVLTTAALDEAGNPLVAGFDVFFFTIDTTVRTMYWDDFGGRGGWRGMGERERESGEERATIRGQLTCCVLYAKVVT